MYTIYRLNADELNADFIESLQKLFKHKQIEISVCEADTLGAIEIEHRRTILSSEAKEAIALFEEGTLKMQTSDEVISELRTTLTEE